MKQTIDSLETRLLGFFNKAIISYIRFGSCSISRNKSTLRTFNNNSRINSSLEFPKRSPPEVVETLGDLSLVPLLSINSLKAPIGSLALKSSSSSQVMPMLEANLEINATVGISATFSGPCNSSSLSNSLTLMCVGEN
ncbi:hypothetical protein P8452_43279 [Trifolium repens]|nr:hypothetical protein P8452_43279 [Trifolium repens]